VADEKLIVQEDSLAAGLSLQTGTRYQIELVAPAQKDALGQLDIEVRGHDGHDPVIGQPYRIRGPHSLDLSGNTDEHGAIRPGRAVPIDTYSLVVCDQTFSVHPRGATSGPLIIRVPGLGQEPPPDRSFGPPPRSGGPGGREFLRSCTDVTGLMATPAIEKRDGEIFQQLKNGNLPDFCRVWSRVHLSDDRGNVGEVRVLSDCLALGSNDDWVRVNLSAYTSQRIADEWKCLILTTKILKEAYAQAAHPLIYHALDCVRYGGMYQSSNLAMRWHDDIVQGIADCDRPPANLAETRGKFDPQVGVAAFRNLHRGRCKVPSPHPGTLVVGHKKEVVICHEQSDGSHKNGHGLSFMGFFQADGEPLQAGWGAAHGAGFTDYAQGTRLVHPVMMVNGSEMSYAEVLTSERYYRLVVDVKPKRPSHTDAGPYKSTRYPNPIPGRAWPG
jgi:hypothetical protein